MVGQSPGGDTRVPPGSTVNLVVAKEPTTAKVPDVTGDTARGATDELQAAGLKVSEQTKDVTKQNKDGIVISQDPGAGSTLNKGSTVTIVIGQLHQADADHTDDSHHAHHPDDADEPEDDADHPDDADHAVSRVRVAVLGGGRSSEHDVSLASAASVSEGLRTAGHEVRLIEIGADGVWRADGDELSVRPGRGFHECDVVFPVLHGPFGEDGTVQGLLECLDVPYVGAGVLASALCMDKVMFKHLMAREGVPQVDYEAVTALDWRASPRRTLAGLARLGLPVFVKPARLGSSVGIARVSDAGGLEAALDTAFEHDSLAIVEAYASGLEVECSVLGNHEPIASEPGEIMLAARRVRLVRLRGQVHARGDAAGRARPGSGGRARAGARARGEHVRQERLPRARPRRLLRRRR